MTTTNIEWTDRSWNPVRGCRRVSPGCERCYAERTAARFVGSHYEGLVRLGPKGPRWTGDVRLLPEKLNEPLRWRKPQRIFVNSMSDLFHEDVPDEFIAAVFGVMAACPQHTFQVLTKRPERMRAVLSDDVFRRRVEAMSILATEGRIADVFAAEEMRPVEGWPGYSVTSRGRVLSTFKGGRELRPMAGESGHSRVMLYRDGESSRFLVHRLVLDAFVRPAREGEQGCHLDGDATNNALWNLRWGTQSDNWDDRRRHGRFRSHHKLTESDVETIRRRCAAGETAAAVARDFGISDTQARNIVTGKQWSTTVPFVWPLPSVWLGVSVEDQQRADERIPLLLETPAAVRFLSMEPLLGPVDLAYAAFNGADSLGSLEGLHWVIVGGESGPGARPCHVDWIRSVVAQCKAAAVPCFTKQLGARPQLEPHVLDGVPVTNPLRLESKKGSDMSEWPADLRVREFPEVAHHPSTTASVDGGQG